MTTTDSSSIRQCQHVAKENDEECHEEEYAICPHCNRWLCNPHIQDHQQILQNDTNIVHDRANRVRQQLTELSIDHLYEEYKEQIDEWRDQKHAEINGRHAEMLQQLTKLHNELSDEVKEFKMEKIESFAHEIVEPLTYMLTKQKQVHPARLKTIETRLQSLESAIEDITEYHLIHMNYDEIKLNGEINFTREHPCKEKAERLSHHPSIKLDAVTKKYTRHFALETNLTSLGASSRHILTCGDNSTLVLFDANNQLQSINIENGLVMDICWSDTMDIFIIAGLQLQSYDVHSDTLSDNYSINSTSVNSIWSITSCYHDMFLLRKDIGIVQRCSLPSFTLKKEWSNKQYLDEDKDQIGRCVRMNSNGVLAMTIKQNDLHWRIDLFNMQMQRLHRGVPFTNNVNDGVWQCKFSSIINNEWLLMDNSSKPQMLSLFDKEGELKEQVELNGCNVALMGTEFLVLRASHGLYLYKLA